MRKELLQEATSTVLGPIENHLKYPKATLAAGLAVVATAGLALASTEIPRDGGANTASQSATGQEHTTPLDSEPRISSGLSNADWWACDPSIGPAYISVGAYSSYPEQQAKFAADDPVMWGWVTGVIRREIEKDPFIDEYQVSVEVQYDDPNGAVAAQAQAHRIESLASQHLDLPEGNPLPAQGNANIRHTTQDVVEIQAIRPAICPN